MLLLQTIFQKKEMFGLMKMKSLNVVAVLGKPPSRALHNAVKGTYFAWIV